MTSRSYVLGDHQQASSSRSRGSACPIPVAPPTPAQPALTLLTWAEYNEFNTGNSNRLGLSGDDTMMNRATDGAADDMFGGVDESDDDDFGSNMSDDDMVPASLWKATCVPTFAVDSFEPSSGTESSPSVPSNTLDESVNTPTFALVNTQAYQAHAVWRDTQPDLASCSTNTLHATAKPSSSTGRKPRGRSPKSQSRGRKRKPKGTTVAPNDELNAAASAATAKALPSVASKHQPRAASNGNRKKQRHPLQPKVPNAPVVDEVLRSVTA